MMVRWKFCDGRRIFVFLVMVLFLNWPLVNALNISNVRVEEITENDAVVKWETDEAADGFVSYGLDKDDLETVGDASLVYNHSFELSELANSTAYYFKVKSGGAEDDNEGNFYSFETSEAVVEVGELSIEVEIPELVGDDKIDIFGGTKAGAEVRLEVNGEFAGVKTAEDGNFSFVDVRLEADAWNTVLVSVKDLAGNKNSSEFRVFSDVSKPRIVLEELPEIVTESKVELKGNLSENVSLSVLVNNRSVYSEWVNEILVELMLQEGENSILVVAEDGVGLKEEIEMKVSLSSRPPEVKGELAKGNSYYQGRAETDVVGETEPGAKVYLYYFRREVYEREPDFSRAYAVATADEEGKVKFSDVDFEHPPIILEDLKPKEIPVGLKEVIIYPFEAAKEQQQWIYEVYLISEDELGRTGFWKQIVTIYTCYTADYAFHVDPMMEFQMPYRLDPGMLDEGRQVISAIFNLDYAGEGIATDEEEGFRIIGNPRLEKACTPGMLEEDGFKTSCKIFSRPRLKGSPDKKAWFMQTTLARTSELSERKADFWDDLKDRQLVFPLKMTVSYQERGADGKWGSTKTQVSCFDLGYMVDVPLESKEMIPDFLADEGVEALNWTIDKIDVVLPYLQKAMLVTGIGCGLSIVAKMATRWYRLFISKLEPYTSLGKEKKCPKKAKKQNKLILESTAKGKGWTGQSLTDENNLDKICPMTAGAWKAEAALNTALRWTCDRFFCHEAPAGWTEDKSRSEVMTAKMKEQACGSQAGRCIPLREIENCKKHVDQHPGEFSKPALESKEFKDFLESGENVCYVDAEGFVYYFNSDYPANREAEEKGTRIYTLTGIGDRRGTKLGTASGKKLVAYLPEGAENYCVGLDTTCEKVCKKRSGYVMAKDICENGCCEVNKDGSLRDPDVLKKGKGAYYVADYTKDCFPQSADDSLKTCVCKREEETGKPGEGTREANPEEEWSYRQAMLFRETGGNSRTCIGGGAGICYPKWRYYSGRDLSAAFGQDHILDMVTPGEGEITEVNPFTQYLGTWQAVCISGIYNQLRLLQSILIGMRNCLVEAKYTGLHDAGMCKEIFSQAVCGLMYKLIAYAAKGCLPIPFFSSDKEGDESVWAKGIGFGLGAVHDTLETTMTDLTEEYGNAKLNEYFATGAQGVVKNICLAAFGYDWPYGMDMMMDAAYRVPMKTTALIVPAEMELVSYNPTKGTAIYNYRVGASIFPGCEIKSYTVKLKCVGPEDSGKENVVCDSYEDCPCMAATETFMEAEKERLLYRDVKGVNAGSYVSVPVPSPESVDSVFRYDHVVMELQLTRFEDAEKCFDSEYREGSKGVFYAPITDVSVKPLVACQADLKKGTFTCPDLTKVFGMIGNTYLEPPFVECWNSRKEEWRKCKATKNNFILADRDIIRIRPHIFTDGKKQCLHVKLAGMPERIYPIPENMGPSYKPPLDLAPVTEELLGGVRGEFDFTGSCGSPGYIKKGEIQDYMSVTFTYNKVDDKYRLKVNKQIEVESPYDVEGGYLVRGEIKELSENEIKEAVFRFGGYEVRRGVVDLEDNSGSCRYEIRPGGKKGLGKDMRDLSLTIELRNPTKDGDCAGGTKLLKPALGEAVHRTSIIVQREEVYEAAIMVSELHKYWESRHYELLFDEAAGIIAKDGNDLGEALAYYYAVAANVMLGNKENAGVYVKLFEEEKEAGHYDEIKGVTEYEKIEKYLEEIKENLK